MQQNDTTLNALLLEPAWEDTEKVNAASKSPEPVPTPEPGARTGGIGGWSRRNSERELAMLSSNV